MHSYTGIDLQDSVRKYANWCANDGISDTGIICGPVFERSNLMALATGVRRLVSGAKPEVRVDGSK